MTAIIISVGDELISGQIVDTNSFWIARKLADHGVAVVSHWTVGDNIEQIADAITLAAKQVELVFVSGGIGPTQDDLTREALGKALACPLVLDAGSLERIEDYFHFRSRGLPMSDINRKQAMIPQGAEALINAQGTAPGIVARLGDSQVFVTPGVPAEMRAMFNEQIAPRIGQGANRIVHRVVHTFGLGESTVAELLGNLMDRSANPTIGTTVAAGLVSIRITSRSQDEDQARREAERIIDELKRRLGEAVVGEEDQSLASVVGKLLRREGSTLSLAESCTGGLIGKMLTDIPSSSEYFSGGIIAYSNDVKQQLLNVPEQLITEQGAVSDQVADVMANSVRKLLGTDYAISVTGIAGPGGAGETKPVGLVYIALADVGGVEVHRHIFGGSRETIRTRTSLAALNYMRLKLIDAPADI